MSAVVVSTQAYDESLLAMGKLKKSKQKKSYCEGRGEISFLAALAKIYLAFRHIGS